MSLVVRKTKYLFENELQVLLTDSLFRFVVLPEKKILYSIILDVVNLACSLKQHKQRFQAIILYFLRLRERLLHFGNLMSHLLLERLYF